MDHLASDPGAGGRICEDDFVLEAAHKEKLRELLAALGPMEAGWSASRPPIVIEVGGQPSAR